jgi:hypothetical protein
MARVVFWVFLFLTVALADQVAVEVMVHRNGGGNVRRVTVRKGEEGLHDLQATCQSFYPGNICNVHNDGGTLLKSLKSVTEGQHVFLVPQKPLQSTPALREPFLWPAIELERRVKVRGVRGPKGQTLEMVTKSLAPRVFEIEDFLSAEECEAIVQFASKRIKAAQTVEVGGDALLTGGGG